MSLLRPHLRLLAIVWVLSQAATLVAFVPSDCCDAHGRAQLLESCHASDAAGESCPMKRATGVACPMHEAAETGGAEDCSMRGVCNEQPVALAGLRAVPGVLPAAASFDVPVTASPVQLADAPVLSTSSRPPYRPPRA